MAFLQLARRRIRRRLFRLARYSRCPNRWLENVLGVMPIKDRKKAIGSGRLLEALHRYVAVLGQAHELLTDDERSVQQAHYAESRTDTSIARERNISLAEVESLRDSASAKITARLISAGLLAPAAA